MHERTVYEIASECVHYIGIDGDLTPECNSKDKLQDLVLMICLATVYPDKDNLEINLSN